ncbi:MAG: hypothetical protein EU544_01975 [Promethearchaeota archaeon]|nr:MAG: hypothetical protein EU544_01975 [Candidatus Lokiarchaeota archaeon]
MKIRREQGLIIILFLIILQISTQALALKYEIYFKEEEEISWVCNVCKSEQMENALGNNWDKGDYDLFLDIKEGAKMKWQIEKIDKSEQYCNTTDQKEDGYLINYGYWAWTEEENWGSKEETKKEFAFENPKYYPEDFIYPVFAPVWMPGPVGEYMKELESRLYKGYTVDGRVLLTITCELEKKELDDKYPKQYIKVLAMYTDKGILRSYKLYLEDHHVILDISLEDIPYVELIFPIILTALLISGTLYVLWKKVD